MPVFIVTVMLAMGNERWPLCLCLTLLVCLLYFCTRQQQRDQLSPPGLLPEEKFADLLLVRFPGNLFQAKMEGGVRNGREQTPRPRTLSGRLDDTRKRDVSF